MISRSEAEFINVLLSHRPLMIRGTPYRQVPVFRVFGLRLAMVISSCLTLRSSCLPNPSTTKNMSLEPLALAISTYQPVEHIFTTFVVPSSMPGDSGAYCRHRSLSLQDASFPESRCHCDETRRPGSSAQTLALEDKSERCSNCSLYTRSMLMITPTLCSSYAHSHARLHARLHVHPHVRPHVRFLTLKCLVHVCHN